MKNSDYFFPILLNIRNNLKNETKQMDLELKKMPEGSIFFRESHGKMRPYHQKYQNNETSNGKVRMQRYLSKKDQVLIAQLKRKRYISKMLPLMQKNLVLLTEYLDHAQWMLQKKSEIEDKLFPEQKNVNADIMKAHLKKSPFEKKEAESDPVIASWLKENENRSDKAETRHKENLIHTLSDGMQVRSKSEAAIIGMLQMRRVPFSYEVPLELSGQVFFPDFTIMRRRDHKVFYWEHFGMVYDIDYRKRMKTKLEIYEKNGIVPWDNLLISYDDVDGAIDLQVIGHMIDGHLI